MKTCDWCNDKLTSLNRGGKVYGHPVCNKPAHLSKDGREMPSCKHASLKYWNERARFDATHDKSEVSGEIALLETIFRRKTKVKARA